ncbi:DUF3016 domain-containing protein [Pseudorhodoferax sp. Leaf267]|uniref:DUF3016 domain-containing protein n=1 Tax=Pseudorhodoferax sp. Leaf267 TaxID=1736316 RepID=UPI0006FF56AD|nr:DUF3016 domain-containing protein [Pseudorhodoferax sp. Leaf267]KQP21496.1 hypothetical protein ASF43_26370 [Pseudorhodoferax sp. Leaf267]
MTKLQPPVTTGHWRWLVLAAACALAACANPFAGRPMDTQMRAGVAAGTVSVTYGDPARFSDARDGRHESDSARRAWLDALSEHLSERAAAALPTGERLEVHLTDVKRAGSFEPWRGAQAADLRVVRDIYPPRIDLDFKRLAANGRVLQSGSRQLRDLNFMMRPSPYANDPLRFEKVLVDDWVGREFSARR